MGHKHIQQVRFILFSYILFFMFQFMYFEFTLLIK